MKTITKIIIKEIDNGLITEIENANDIIFDQFYTKNIDDALDVISNKIKRIFRKINKEKTK